MDSDEPAGGARRPGRKRRRRIRLVAGLTTALVIIAAVVATAVKVYYFPRSDAYDPATTDAVIVLGPPISWRITAAEQLAASSGGIPIYLSTWSGVVCEPQFRCVHADPWTTKGEAKALREILARDGVRHPVVLTGTTHLARARYIFHRCVGPWVPVIGVDDHLAVGTLLAEPFYQTAAFVKAVATPCA